MDEIEQMVRDFTRIPPYPKSEVRRRLNELFAAGEKSGAGKAVLYIEKNIVSIDKDDVNSDILILDIHELDKLLEAARSISREEK